ncbi:hypothetical protein EYC80_004319 [Monilinia laxa]|uniref:adenine phosphoribosyltransferase n=1 Tax=Monilinia laxa TaxID=61186 RepID=A0A5N6KME4_MONLA|nr:hypothetical protein EYC80_004319 [Monilinia laxa]
MATIERQRDDMDTSYNGSILSLSLHQPPLSHRLFLTLHWTYLPRFFSSNTPVARSMQSIPYPYPFRARQPRHLCCICIGFCRYSHRTNHLLLPAKGPLYCTHTILNIKLQPYPSKTSLASSLPRAAASRTLLLFFFLLKFYLNQPTNIIIHRSHFSLLNLAFLSSLFTMSTSPQTPESNQQLTQDNASQRREPESTPSSSELTSVTLKLRKALRNFADFPIPGIDFVDILPLFANHDLHESLIRALELQVLLVNDGKKPDVIVGLDARGFLFGPSLALRLGAGFAPVRKRGKLPGPTEEASFEKEYGQDFFQMQKDAIKPGQSVLVVDDIIATVFVLTDDDRRKCPGCRKARRTTRRKLHGIFIYFGIGFLERA